MIIPLTHEKMTFQRLPWITILIIAANVYIFLVTHHQAQREEKRLYQVMEELQELAEVQPGIMDEEFSSEEGLGEYKRLVEEFQGINRTRLFGRYGFVPARPEWPDVLSSVFLHGGWMHLLGNMYLLWLCGCSVEDRWGRPVYTAIYLASGLVAVLAHAAAFPESEAPLVGASGAIAGLMGAFLVRLYATRIRFFYLFWIHWGTFHAPAWVMLPLWLLSQLFYAFMNPDGSPVAFWAHVGGFLFGAAAALFIKLTLVEEAFLAPAIDQKTNLFAQNPKVTSALLLMERGKTQDALRPLQLALRDDPYDVDALDLLADAFRAVGRPADAAQACGRKLRAHLKRREKDLAAAAYSDMLECNPDASLPPRDLLAVAAALSESERYHEAETLYRELVDSDAADDLIRLRASLALADIYLADHKGQRALDLLERAAPWAETLPEWEGELQARMNEAKLSGVVVSKF